MYLCPGSVGAASDDDEVGHRDGDNGDEYDDDRDVDGDHGDEDDCAGEGEADGECPQVPNGQEGHAEDLGEGPGQG